MLATETTAPPTNRPRSVHALVVINVRAGDVIDRAGKGGRRAPAAAVAAVAVRVGVGVGCSETALGPRDGSGGRFAVAILCICGH